MKLLAPIGPRYLFHFGAPWPSWLTERTFLDWVDLGILLIIATWFLMDRCGVYLRGPK